MTEVGELVAPGNAADLENKCPFCTKEDVGHKNAEDEKNNDTSVTSKPDGLKCKGDHPGRSDGDLPYTVAQHHLISAMQCYAHVKRLVRMGNMCGYDINAPKNGIGLPTTHWTLTYPEGGTQKKYGKLEDPAGKRRVSHALMKELGAQWHVGHHSFAVTVPKKDADSFEKGGTDESGDEDYPHETRYDVVIVKRLLNLLETMPKALCEDEERDEKFKEEMDKISDDIRDHLDKFNTDKPADSSPFFVSMRAYEYSGVASLIEDDEMDFG